MVGESSEDTAVKQALCLKEARLAVQRKLDLAWPGREHARADLARVSGC
jgi:hypothetical protein